MDKQIRRPWFVTLVTYGVFLLAIGSFLEAAQGVLQYRFLGYLPLSVPPWYFVAGGVFWGAAWSAVGFGLWMLQNWARRLALIFIPVNLVVWLADRILLSRSAESWQTLGLDIAIRILATLTAMGILLWAAKRFQPWRAHQQKPDLSIQQ